LPSTTDIFHTLHMTKPAKSSSSSDWSPFLLTLAFFSLSFHIVFSILPRQLRWKPSRCFLFACVIGCVLAVMTVMCNWHVQSRRILCRFTPVTLAQLRLTARVSTANNHLQWAADGGIGSSYDEPSPSLRHPRCELVNLCQRFDLHSLDSIVAVIKRIFCIYRFMGVLAVLASEGWWEAWQPSPKVTRNY